MPHFELYWTFLYLWDLWRDKSKNHQQNYDEGLLEKINARMIAAYSEDILARSKRLQMKILKKWMMPLPTLCLPRNKTQQKKMPKWTILLHQAFPDRGPPLDFGPNSQLLTEDHLHPAPCCLKPELAMSQKLKFEDLCSQAARNLKKRNLMTHQ